MDHLDVGDDETDLARDEALLAPRLRSEDAHLAHFVLAAVRHEDHLLARLDGALEDADQHDHAAVAVVPAVEDERLERRRRIALGRRHILDDALEQLLDAGPVLGAGGNGFGGVEADDFLDLRPRPGDVGAGQIDLVDDRDDGEVVLESVSIRLRT